MLATDISYLVKLMRLRWWPQHSISHIERRTTYSRTMYIHSKKADIKKKKISTYHALLVSTRPLCDTKI